MTRWPEFNEDGDLPAGVHRADIRAVLDKFGRGEHRRQLMGQRLEHIWSVVQSTRHLRRFIVYGSFVTAKPEPGDVDVFLVMDDDFAASALTPEQRLVFDHMTAHNRLGASIFWVRRIGALGGEQAAVEHWQLKRNGTKRGIVEVVEDDS